jgi:hypothetical protein
MNKPSATWLAWTLWALALMQEGLLRLLDFKNGHVVSPPATGTLSGIAMATIGALIASRRPANPIGWLFLTTMLLEVFGGPGNFAEQYAIYTLLTRPGALPGGGWLLWLGNVARILGVVPLITFLLLWIPDGRLPSARWRIVAWAAAFCVPLTVGLQAVDPAPLSAGSLTVRNPLGAEGVRAIFGTLEPVLKLVGIGLVLASVAATVARYRRAQGDERQQLKWFAYGALIIPLVGGVGLVSAILNLNWLADVASPQLSIAAIPIVTGIAILRHRLYDIDLLINRTLVYGLLTVALALMYVASVVALQGLFRALAGHQSDLAIVASTLAIAAPFQPMRRHFQAFIDQRFYRRRYDAAHVLATFGSTVRDEVDLARLADSLLAAVEETMQPRHVSLWLRQPIRPSPWTPSARCRQRRHSRRRLSNAAGPRPVFHAGAGEVS